MDYRITARPLAFVIPVTLALASACGDSSEKPDDSEQPAHRSSRTTIKGAIERRPPDRCAFLMDTLWEAEVSSPLIDAQLTHPIELALADLSRDCILPGSDEQAHPIHVFALPVAPDETHYLELIDGDGNSIEETTPPTLVDSSIIWPCAELKAFEGFPRRRDNKGEYHVHITQSGRVEIPLEDFGVGLEVMLRARPGPGGAGDDESKAATLLARFDGREVDRVAVTTPLRSLLNFHLAPFVGVKQLTLEFQDVVTGVGSSEMYLVSLAVRRPDGKTRLLLEGGEDVTDWAVGYTPKLPPVNQVVRSSRQPGRSTGVHTLLIPGTCSVITDPPQPFEVLLNGESLGASPPGMSNEVRFEVRQQTWGHLDVKASRRGNFVLVQPGVLYADSLSVLREVSHTPTALPRLRGQEEEEGADHPLVAHVMFDDETHRSLLCLAPTEAIFPLWVNPGERLRFNYSVVDMGERASHAGHLDFEMVLHDSHGRQHPLLEEGVLRRRQRWNEVEVELPAAAAGPAELHLTLRPPKKALLSAHQLLVCLAEPTILAAGPSRQPNVLVYLIDTLRSDHCSAYGYSRPTTPRLDRLAEDGILFERAYSQAPWTRPSVATLFTGLYYGYHGAGKVTGLSPRLTTLSEHLRHAGFATAAFMANAHVHGPSLNFEQGFSHFVGVEKKRGESRASDVNELVLPWLEKHKDQPFFLYVHTIDPHAAYDPPAATAGTFQAPDYDGPIQPSRTQAYNLRNIKNLAPRDVQHLLDLYDEEILFNDRQLGVLLRKLKELELYENTIIAVVSDHGEEFYEHGSFGHGRRLWEELLRVPLVLKLAGQDRPRAVRVPEPVGIIDLFPTLSALSGLSEAKTASQGLDLAPWWRGEAPKDRDLLAHEEPADSCLIRGSMKLIEWNGRSKKKRHLGLFDLEKDPREQNNLALENPELAEHWYQELRRAESKLGQNFRPVEGLEEAEMTREQRLALEALGYIEVEEPPPSVPR